MNWENKHYKDVIQFLESDAENGLGEARATQLLTKYGKNELKEKKRTSIIVKFFMQFNDFMIIILLIAAGVSLFVSYLEGKPDFVDPIVILLIVVLNAILGLVQESKAEKALEALKKMSAPTGKVIRSGKCKQIETSLIVPGDIIVLEQGDFIPADARLIKSNNLRIEESALTGESFSVEKDENLIIKKHTNIGDRKNMVFSSSSISSGRGIAIVCETGMNTEVGKIANMIMEHEDKDTPLQKKLAHTGKILGLGALFICLLIFLIGILKNMPPFFVFMTSVSLAVAAIPEGLPAIVTIMLAIGVQRMAKRNAVIRKLPAVETLGSANVICSDKTGTLTQNKMKVIEVSDANGHVDGKSLMKKNILKLATLCNDTVLLENNNEVLGEPTETAIVIAALNLEINKNEDEKMLPRVNEVPFDSKRKLMSTIHKNGSDGYIIITKGAPDFLLNKCTHYVNDDKVMKLTNSKREEILNINSKMAYKALRVLGVAYKTVENKPSNINNSIESELVFTGLIGMIDPPRESVKSALETCKKAGIRVVMLTGDHIITATAIAKKIGIMLPEDKAITGEKLSKLSNEELSNNIFEYSVFARLAPEHKVRIVKAFQTRGAVVAMTGDGVNDAPALKAADIGCAMGITGTDVARGAADMILLDDNFGTIVEAVKEGRGIYSNIKKAVHFLISSNIGEILVIFIAILMGFDTPLLAIHLLWVNLVTDSLPAIALGLDPVEKDIMERKPFESKKSLFSDGLGYKIFFEGCMIGLLALIAFGIGTVYFDTNSFHNVSRTMTFATLSISQLVHSFNMRSEKSIFSINIFENMYLIYALLVGALLQISVITIPVLNKVFKVVELSLSQWGVVILLSFMPILIVELEKFFTKGINEEKNKTKLNISKNMV